MNEECPPDLSLAWKGWEEVAWGWGSNADPTMARLCTCSTPAVHLLATGANFTGD